MKELCIKCILVQQRSSKCPSMNPILSWMQGGAGVYWGKYRFWFRRSAYCAASFLRSPRHLRPSPSQMTVHAVWTAACVYNKSMHLHCIWPKHKLPATANKRYKYTYNKYIMLKKEVYKIMGKVIYFLKKYLWRIVLKNKGMEVNFRIDCKNEKQKKSTHNF